ncbi:MAG: hypothetical protein KJO82_11685 [Gammaproteobacteria bacterium]|nr:hypothetical protein [Gammaproteobacteria bacterium]
MLWNRISTNKLNLHRQQRLDAPDLDGGETFQPYYSTVGLDLLAPTPDGCTVNLSLQAGASAGAVSPGWGHDPASANSR